MPLWSLLHGSRLSDFLPLIVGSIGATVGLIIAVRLCRRDGSGGRFFAVAYPAVVTWAILVNERGYLVAAAFVGVWIAAAYAIASAASRVQPRLVQEAWKIAAAVVWVLTVLTLPLLGLGFGVLPLAIALTAVVRASESDRATRDHALR
jgi:hypothetical protein